MLDVCPVLFSPVQVSLFVVDNQDGIGIGLVGVCGQVLKIRTVLSFPETDHLFTGHHGVLPGKHHHILDGHIFPVNHTQVKVFLGLIQ